MLLRLVLVLVIGLMAALLATGQLAIGSLPARFAAVPAPMILFIAIGAVVLAVIAFSGRSRSL